MAPEAVTVADRFTNPAPLKAVTKALASVPLTVNVICEE